jgi:hypothetical protein
MKNTLGDGGLVCHRSTRQASWPIPQQHALPGQKQLRVRIA